MAVRKLEDELREYVRRFLEERFTMTLATEGPDGPWIASVYFAGGLLSISPAAWTPP